MVFTFTIQNAFGTRLTGLSPSFVHFKDITNPASPANLSAPTIYEIGSGEYGFSYDMAWKVVNFVLDGGATASPRYQSSTFDMRLETAILNKLLINAGTSKLEAYNESGSTKVAEWPLTDSAGGAINLGGTTQPCNRGSAVDLL